MSVLNLIRDIESKYDIVIYEGFDMVGKTYLLNKLMNSNDDVVDVKYKPNWNIMNDKVVSRGNRHIVGLAVIELFSDILNTSGRNLRLIIDRGLPSSVVYKSLYNQKSDYDEDELIKAFNLSVDGSKVLIIHKNHKSKEDALKFYENAVSDNDHNDDYDVFGSFDDYYEKYLLAEELYNKIYNKLQEFSNITIMKVDAYNTKFEVVS